MKNLIKTNGLTSIAIMTSAFAVVKSQAAVSVLNDNISGGLDSASDIAQRDDSQWSEKTSGGWTYGAGNTWMHNTTTGDTNTKEGGLVRTIALGGLGLATEDELSVSFNYSAWGGAAGATGLDDLYVHVWGLKNVSSTATSGVADLTNTGGDLFGDATDYATFTRDNLKDGSSLATASSSVASSAAFTLENFKLSDTNNGTASTASFTLNQFGTLADYDYLVIGLAIDAAGSSGESFALREISIEASQVPEPSSSLLLGLGGLSLLGRRKRG